YLKAALQGTLSVLPFSRTTNYLFQRYVSKGLHPTQITLENKLSTFKTHLENYRFALNAPDARPERVLEIGTGWLPFVPIAFALAGVAHIITIDKVGLTRRTLLQETLDLFLHYAEQGTLQTWLPLAENRLSLLEQARKRIDTEGIKEALEALHIEARVQDVRELTTLPPPDLFVSNNTYEHIPGEVLRSILKMYRRLAHERSVLSDMIDLTDHYVYFDKTITPYNFLNYSERTWRWFNNPLQYQNRLRISDYRQFYEENGFRILREENKRAAETLPTGVRLAKEFAHYAPQDLLVTESWVIAVPAAPTV
ncbi:MAG TPA: class I SAM-dependent methyltransferase, partial [Aggregatilineales bacterium]|nr:class I SAM-dependent methyltransferase [Aggregatilineales bacterium]